MLSSGEVQEILIGTPKGHSLSATQFSISDKNLRTVIISSATGVLQNFYRKFVTYLASLGYIVFTFDYYGVGKSGSDMERLKSNELDLKSGGSNDQATIVAFAKERYPQSEPILITHSIGGQILGFNPNYRHFDKIAIKVVTGAILRDGIF